MFQKPYENRHRQQRQDSDDGSPKMEQRNNRPNNKQHHNQQNQQQQRGDGGESGGRGGGGGGGGGQYYNNNRNNNQQQNRDMGTSRELPPRFMKKLQQQQVGQFLLECIIVYSNRAIKPSSLYSKSIIIYLYCFETAAK